MKRRGDGECDDGSGGKRNAVMDMHMPLGNNIE